MTVVGIRSVVRITVFLSFYRVYIVVEVIVNNAIGLLLADKWIDGHHIVPPLPEHLVVCANFPSEANDALKKQTTEEGRA
jgi:hypothetical protein